MFGPGATPAHGEIGSALRNASSDAPARPCSRSRRSEGELRGMGRLQSREGLVKQLIQLLVVLGGVGLEFASEVRRNLEIEGGSLGLFWIGVRRRCFRSVRAGLAKLKFRHACAGILSSHRY